MGRPGEPGRPNGRIPGDAARAGWIPAQLDEELRSADWARIRRGLLRYAICRARIYGWSVGPDDTLAGGITAQDVVSRAITDVCTGSRIRASAAHMDLESYLRSVVNSLVWRAANSAPRSRERRLPCGADQSELRDHLESRARQLPDVGRLAPVPPDPGEVLAGRIHHGHWAAALGTLRARIRAIPELLELVDAALADGGHIRPRNVATRLGLPVEEVYQRVRRLRRHGRRLRDEVDLLRTAA